MIVKDVDDILRCWRLKLVHMDLLPREGDCLGRLNRFSLGPPRSSCTFLQCRLDGGEPYRLVSDASLSCPILMMSSNPLEGNCLSFKLDIINKAPLVCMIMKDGNVVCS